MSRQRRRPLELESLEGKMLLSTVQPTTATVKSSQILDGTFTSNVKSVRTTGTTNPTITQIFKGKSAAFGKASGVVIENVDSTSNTISSAGFVIQNKYGSIHLNFSSDGLISHKSNKRMSSEVLAYTVDGGTDSFASATGTGTFTMTYTFKSGLVQIKLHSL